jgi:hypothetical protein
MLRLQQRLARTYVVHERLTFSASEKAKKVLLSAKSGSTLFMKKFVVHDKLLLLVFPAGQALYHLALATISTVTKA